MGMTSNLLDDLDADLALLFFELGIDGAECSSHHRKDHSNAHVFKLAASDPPSVVSSSVKMFFPDA